MNEEHLIKKWLNNDLSEIESKAFYALDDAHFYESIIEEAQLYSGMNHAKVKPFESIETKIVNKSSKLNWLRILPRIAAIFIIGLTLFTLFNRDHINSFNTDYAQNETITLPDLSIVKLNELSQLTYNESNWDDNRILNLNGEAYFDVEKGNLFEVQTPLGNVSVLGTEFNVLSRDSIFKVSCYEGLVKVSYDNANIKLPAGTEFILTSGKGKKSSIAIAEPYWLKNMSVFENAPINIVLTDLEKQYNLTIIKEFNEKDMLFTGAFEHNHLENALKSITSPLNLTYTIQNTNEVIIRNEQN